MSQISNAPVAVIGIDIGKNSFHVVGHDARGAIVLRQSGRVARSTLWQYATVPGRHGSPRRGHAGAKPPAAPARG